MTKKISLQLGDALVVLKSSCKATKPELVRSSVDFSRYSKQEAFLIEKFFAEMGVADAQFYLGQCFDYGWGGQKKNLKTAKFWYDKAVKKVRHPNAAFNLAQIIQESKAKKVAGQVAKLFEISARAGNSDAMLSLGVLYFEKFQKTGQKNMQGKFISLYQGAAKLRHPSALYNLYMCYKNGSGVSQNSAIALSYLRAAAKEGHKKAKTALRRS